METYDKGHLRDPSVYRNKISIQDWLHKVVLKQITYFLTNKYEKYHQKNRFSVLSESN
jgi:hypothetical protein